MEDSDSEQPDSISQGSYLQWYWAETAFLFILSVVIHWKVSSRHIMNLQFMVVKNPAHFFAYGWFVLLDTHTWFVPCVQCFHVKPSLTYFSLRGFNLLKRNLMVILSCWTKRTAINSDNNSEANIFVSTFQEKRMAMDVIDHIEIIENVKFPRIFLWEIDVYWNCNFKQESIITDLPHSGETNQFTKYIPLSSLVWELMFIM